MDRFPENRKELYSVTKIHIIIGLIFTLVFPFNINGQEIATHHFGIEDGLPSNEVYDNYQDKNGLLWFATDNGISSYDGKNFTNYNVEDGLTCKTVFRFYPQKDGKIWCSTFNNRLFYFYADEIVFHEYEFNELLKNEGKSFVIDDLLIENNNLYLSYLVVGEIIHINPDGLLIKNISINNQQKYLKIEKTINGYDFRSISKDTIPSIDKSNVLATHSLEPTRTYTNTFQLGELSIFSEDNKLILKKGKEIIQHLISEKKIANVGAYDSLHFWVSYFNGGLKIFDLNGHQIQHLLKNQSVSYHFLDHRGKEWIATLNHGIYYVENVHLRKYNFNYPSSFKKIALGADGLVWLKGSDESIYQIKNGILNMIIDWNAAVSMPPYSHYDNLNELHIEFPLIIINDEYYTIPNGFFFPPKVQFNPSKPTNLNPNRIYDIVKIRNTYFVGNDFGVEQIREGIPNKSFKIEEIDSKVNDLEKIGDTLVIGSESNGLAFYYNNKLSQYNVDNGLFSNFVECIEIENNKIIWIGTNKGLNLLTKSDTTWNLQRIEYFQKTRIYDLTISNDSIWIASDKGLFALKKGTNDYSNSLDFFFLKLSRIEVNNQKIEFDQNQFNSIISIDFYIHAVSFIPNKKLNYRYKLSGLESEWNYSNENRIEYLDLDPGEYELQAQVSIDGKNWSKEIIKYPFKIEGEKSSNYLWLILTILTLFISFGLFLFYYKKKTKTKTQSKQEIVIREQGKDVFIDSPSILFINSAGNYLDIVCEDKKHTIRCKIGSFLDLVPDKEAYLRIHRSYIIRVDQIEAKTSNSVIINGIEIKVSGKYLEEFRLYFQ